MTNGNNHWHLDRRIPVGIIFTIALQTLVFAYFLGNLENRVTQIESSRFTAADGARWVAQASQNKENIDKLELRTMRSLDEIKSIVGEIDRKLDAHNQTYSNGVPSNRNAR